MEETLTLTMPEEESSNFTITVKNGPGVWKFPVHTYFLKKHSPVLKAMLENEFLEKNNRELVIQDYTGLHVQQFLKCLYFGKLPFQLVDVLEVLKIADKYEATSVLKKCNDHLVQELKLDNVLQLLGVSGSYRLKALEEKCFELLFNIAFFFLDTENFINLAQSSVKELLSADTLNVVAEMQVFRAALRWLKFNVLWVDIASRSEILNLVRWNFIKESEYLEILGTESIPKDVDVGVKCSVRVSKKISLIPFSKSIRFGDYGCTKNTDLSNVEIPLLLKLVSLEPGTVYITGFEFDKPCNLTADYNIVIYKQYCKYSETIQVRVMGSTTSLQKPYALEKGDYFTYSFQNSSIFSRQYTTCSYRVPLEKSCDQDDFKFICEGDVLLLKKMYYMKP